MKKRKYYIFLFLNLFFLAILPHVSAEELSLECNSKVGQNKSFYCDLSSASNTLIKEIHGEISYNKEVFELEKIVGLSSFESKSNTTLSLISPGGEKDRFKVARIHFKAKQNAPLGTYKLEVTTDNETSNAEVQVQSANNYLSRISIAGIQLGFSKTKNTYDITTDKQSLVINAILEDEKAHFKEEKGPITVSLSYGLNKVLIIVVSESNEENIYTLNITRKDERNNNNYVSSLGISNQKITPNFSKQTLEYHVTVPMDTKSVQVNATLEDKKASFVSGYGPRTVKISSNETKILVQVKAENNDIRTYTIYVDKSNKNNDATLKSLTINQVKFQFDPKVFSYHLKVLYEVTDLNILAIANDPKAKITITGNKNLQVGENQVTVKVISENNNEQTYTLNITRLKEGEILSSNVNLNKIVIIGYNLNFYPEKLNYTLSIKNEKSLDITAITEDPTSYVTINGNENLKDKSIIRIVVTGEDTSQKTYTITIEKTSYFPIVITILAILCVIACIIFLIFKNPKKHFESPKEELKIKKSERDRIVFENNAQTQVFEPMKKSILETPEITKQIPTTKEEDEKE